MHRRLARKPLLALGIAAILPSLILGALLAVFYLQDRRHDVREAALARAEHVITLADAQLDAERAALRVLASATSLEQDDLGAAYERARQVVGLNPHWRSLQLIESSTGRVVFDLGHPPRGASLGDAAAAAAQNDGAVRAGGIGVIGGMRLVRIEAAAGRAGRYRLVVGVDPQVFQTILTRQAPRGTVAAVVDRQGRFIARTVNFEQMLGRPATRFVRAAIAHGKTGVYKGRTYEGFTNYTAFYTSPVTGWSAHLALATSLLDQPRLWSTVVAICAAAAVLGLSLALIWLVLRDMDERRRADETLRQAQKMEAIGQLTGGIAHDFNNLLTAVIGSTDLLVRRLAADPKSQSLAQNALDAARRGAKLTSQLLAFSRGQRIELVPVDLHSLCDGMGELLAQSLGPRIRLDVQVEPDARWVLSDPNQLELAALNLAVNARDAMQGAGEFAIHARRAPVKPDSPAQRGDCVEIVFSDTGPGMSPEVAQRAAEPFFTTKDVGQGTGLGLSQVYGVARQSGGSIEIGGAIGKGALIRMRLPLASPRAEAPAAPVEQAGRQAAGRDLILVVDDDDAVRSFLVESLAAAGYEVLEASSAAAALDLLAYSRPRLLVTDQLMPGLTGSELAARAVALQPGLRVLVVTGNLESAAVDAIPGAGVLHKPFDAPRLTAAVAEALARPDVGRT